MFLSHFLSIEECKCHWSAAIWASDAKWTRAIHGAHERKEWFDECAARCCSSSHVPINERRRHASTVQTLAWWVIIVKFYYANFWDFTMINCIFTVQIVTQHYTNGVQLWSCCYKLAMRCHSNSEHFTIFRVTSLLCFYQNACHPTSKNTICNATRLLFN